MIDDNEFFRRATLRICGNLAIEVAMRDAVRYLEELIPVDRMFMQVYEPRLAAIRTVAMASREGGEQVDLLTPIPDEGRERIRQRAGGIG